MTQTEYREQRKALRTRQHEVNRALATMDLRAGPTPERTRLMEELSAVSRAIQALDEQYGE